MGSSVSSSPAGGHDIDTKSGLTDLYNEKVISAEEMTRGIDSSGSGSTGVDHHGVKALTETGKEMYVDKGPGRDGTGGATTVQFARNVSPHTHTGHGEHPVKEGTTIGSLVGAGGQEYGLLSDNCIDGADRMMQSTE